MNNRNVSALKIIVPPADAAILVSDGEPIMRGKGDMDLVCGHCRTVLVSGETATEVALQYKVMHIVIKCACGNYNALTPCEPAPEDDRQRSIAEAAYFLAEKRGFEPGGALQDWLAAEQQVNAPGPRH